MGEVVVGSPETLACTLAGHRLCWVGGCFPVLTIHLGHVECYPTPATSQMLVGLRLGIVAQVVCFFAFLLWLATGDLFLKFALEDERFYDLATASHALSVFEDTDCSGAPSSGN